VSIKREIYTTYRDLAGFLVFIAVILQSGIIVSNHLQGVYDNLSSGEFLGIIISRSVTGFLSSLIVAVPFIYLIKKLNKKFPWGVKNFKRIIIEFSVVVLTSFLITAIVYLLVWIFLGDTHEADHSLLTGTLIYSITNLLFISSLEGYMFYIEHKRAKLEEAILRDEIARIKLEILKSQINQHFMFNSLNVLSGLLKKDHERALVFIEEFSNIYRYVLETIEQSLTSLDKELEFIRSYLFLQQIRYGNSLKFTENISESHLSLSLPPLSLQVIFENAIKHNIVNEENPLVIRIESENDQLIIKNNFQPKISKFASTGLGQKNIKRRYDIICSESPEFYIEDGCYTARLPLIKQ
jgi:sensor histidine kinase YesM